MKKGFVLAEFVLALPLLILLIFSLGQMSLKIFSLAKEQAADYVLQTEAQEILERISEDAKAAQSVEVKKAVGNADIQEIFFNYRVLGNEVKPARDYFKDETFNSSRLDIVNLIYTSRYTVGLGNEHGYYVYAERKHKGSTPNPISGGNFFGDTTVTRLNFSQPVENILRVELEMQSMVTDKKIKVVTEIFMAACEEKIGL